ncbi:NTP transferase domain-containing protein [Paenibacillus sp. NEAU-GSW1]|uniref:nucleotidyltransferase family protein n=1 Tax=Paenibacillus sp. NEAU-GSW1 TaxID=2682486 RepID=UPI0034649A0D
MYGIYLAAGKSSRMGSQKLELELSEGVPLGGQALHVLLDSELSNIAVIIRPGEVPGWFRSLQQLARPEKFAACRVVVCAHADNGMSYSIRSGINAARSSRNGFDAIAIALADQPFITAEMVRRLLSVLEQDPQLDYAASACDGVPMPPAVFRASMAPALMSLEGDAGARKLFAQPHWKGSFVEFIGEEQKRLIDVDDAQGLADAIEMFKSIF